MLLPPLSREEAATELLDHPGDGSAELADNLRDLARLNRYFGVPRTVLSHLGRLLASADPGGPLWVLDLGTGGADIPVAIVRWARRRGRRLRVLALDRDRAILAHARQTVASYPEITLLQADALALPLREGSVAVAFSTLTLHHFSREEASRFLLAMERVARLGFFVMDLARSRLAYAGVWLATHLLSWNRMTRHDGPLSVRRAYTLEELSALAVRAGIGRLSLHRPRLFRLLAVREKTASAGPEAAQG